MSGRNKKISDVLVGAIHKRFPELSVYWLLFGEGPMLKSDIPAVLPPEAQAGADCYVIPDTSALDEYCSHLRGGQSGVAANGVSDNGAVAPTIGSALSETTQNGPVLTSDRSRVDADANVKALSIAEKRINELVNQLDRLESINVGLQAQIADLTKNPRRVSHITLYYDDSTFETFFPKG